MKEIPTLEIKDGMILAENIYNSSGSILIPKGHSLKSSLSKKLISLNIDVINIDIKEETEALTAEEIAKLTQNITNFFSTQINDSEIKIISNCLINQKINNS